MIAVLGLVLFAAPAFADTLHITSVRKATPAEKSYRTAFTELIITGTFDGKQYTQGRLNC